MQYLSFFNSTIGKKILVALTGLFMVFFLIAHLVGNLEIYSGPDATNQYGVMLRQFPKFLWGFRIALIVSVIVHIYCTVTLNRRNKLARKDPYTLTKPRKSKLRSRTMMISGITVFAFVAYHLAHYTLGITNPEYANLFDDQGRHHVYNMMVLGFSNPLVSLFYIVAQVLLAFHLSHGISSATRSLGVINKDLFKQIQVLGVILSTTIAVLFISVPIAVLFGYLPLVN